MKNESIELLLEKIATEPSNVELHRQLREAGIRRKANGGPRAGTFARLVPLPRKPLQRLIYVARLSALDPGDLELLRQVALALEQLAAARPELDFAPVGEWLRSVSDCARNV